MHICTSTSSDNTLSLPPPFPSFLQVVLGPKLGSGEFSNVYEVQKFQLHEDFAEAATVGLEELDRRTHMKKYEKYRETKNTRYAVKYIKDEYHLHHGSDSYVQAAGYV